MTDLTPEAEAAIRHCNRESAKTCLRAGIYGHDEMSALLAALDEARVERDDVCRRLSELLCDLTGGKLSKPTYPVRLMAQEIEDHLGEALDRDDRERAERAEARIEAVRALLSDVPPCDKYDDGDAVSCGWKNTIVRIGEALEGSAASTSPPRSDDRLTAESARLSMDRPERISRDLATDDDWIDWTEEEP